MSTAPPLIVPATELDLARLAQQLAPEPLFARYGLAPEVLQARWSRALHDGQGLLVAHVERQAVGLCWFTPSGTFGIGAYLRLIAVVGAAQKLGVGAHLLRAYEAACGNPAGGWFLLTSDFNTAAQRFYARHGYTEVGRLPDFAKAGIVEHIYWKPHIA